MPQLHLLSKNDNKCSCEVNGEENTSPRSAAKRDDDSYVIHKIALYLQIKLVMAHRIKLIVLQRVILANEQRVILIMMRMNKVKLKMVWQQYKKD